MASRFSRLALPLALVLPVAGLAQEGTTQQAQNAALAWLAGTDSGKYPASWDQAAAFFKASITRAAWSNALASVRSPLGAVKSRKLKSATYTRALPGAPAGEYVVIQYEAQFQNKPDAIETITPMLEADGTWKVCGYFIK